LMLALLPAYLHRMRAKQIKGAMRKLARARGDEQRQRHTEAAFVLAAGRGRRLVVLAEEAMRAGQPLVVKRALAELERTSQCAEDVARITTKLRGEQRGPSFALEAVVNVEGLLDNGMIRVAQERLDEALRKFPEDPDLQALRPRVAAALSAPDPDQDTDGPGP